MPKEQMPGKPQTRRYSQEEKDAAVRMVRTLGAELRTTQGTVQRVPTGAWEPAWQSSSVGFFFDGR